MALDFTSLYPRAVNQLASVATVVPACGAVDDVVKAGIKAGAKGADEVAGAGAGRLDDVARKGAGNVDGPKPIAVADDSDQLGGAAEFAGEMALEFAPSAFESDAPAPESFVEVVSQPKYVSLAAEPDAWTRLRDSGEGAKQAPWIFDARPQGEGLVVGSEAIAFNELAATCWRLGTTCVFVGCGDDACANATRSVVERLEVAADMRVDAYTQAFVDERMLAAPQPAFVMFAGGSATRQFTLVRAKPL